MANSEDLNPKKRGLGRGLDALFGEGQQGDNSVEEVVVSDTTDTAIASDETVNSVRRKTLPVEWLRPCPFQPRKYFNEEAIAELASSISVHGVLQPIVVRPVSDEENAYEIIAGERRWRASQKAQLHEVPVVIQFLDDEAVLEIALIENLQREDLTAIEEAKAYKQLVDDYGHTQDKLAASLGKSRSYIANMMRLLALPDEVQAMVNDGKLSAGHARALIGQDDAVELAKQIVNNNLSVRDVEKLVRDGKKEPVSRETTKVQKGVNTLALEQEVSNLLGMKVTIDSRGKGAGTLKIDYQNLDQLDDVLHRLSHNPGKIF